MSVPHVWLRAETKPREERRALSPTNASKLVEHGFQLTVERSDQSVFDNRAYEDVGCTCVPEDTWPDDAPPDAYILGLKELPPSTAPLTHRHVYFAHAYKGQAGWEDTLGRFKAGGGSLYDLEYLTGAGGRRVAAFGYWAGFAGAAVAVRAWCAQHDNQPLHNLSSYPNQQTMIRDLSNTLCDRRPRMIVIGALGRCGRGAIAVAEELGLDVTRWDIAETRTGGPFAEIVDHDIFVNCVYVNRSIPPFVTRDTLAAVSRKLSVICDVSCDPSSEFNPLPIYSACSNFALPCTRLIDANPPLDLVAIDHLPSLLPAESSDDFSTQLLPSLLDIENDTAGVWCRAHDLFLEHLSRLA